MKIWLKKVIFWFIAFVITVGAAVFQRMTGPTYPFDVQINSGKETYKIELTRSHGGETDCPIEIELPNRYTGEVVYRKYPGDHKWDTVSMQRANENLLVFLPNQPPAGKLEYHLNIYENDKIVDLELKENIVIRFKGDVPDWALIPHVLFMFFAMLWSNATGLLAAVNIPSYKRNALVTVILFLIGGMILGPIVQKYAFGAYWTGWPFGEDLTDNKVLLSVVVWIAALLLNRKKDRRWMIIVATLTLFAIYMIPHSMRGSELDYSSGEVVTGSLLLLTALPGILGNRKTRE
ncbi:hypothetical protein ACFLT1_09440 [Bacteroidota bacterium]